MGELRETKTKSGRRDRTTHFLAVGLALFGVSLALSKSATNVLITLLYLVALYQVVRYRERRTILAAHLRQPLLLPLALYIGIALLGVFYSENLSDGISIVNKMAGMALVYFMTAVVLDVGGEERPFLLMPQGMLVAFIAGVVVLDIVGLLTYLGATGGRKYVLPVYPLHVHHIWFANINAVAFYTACLFLFLTDARKDPRKRYFLLSFLPLSVLCILLSLSRTAWVGLVITCVISSYFLVRERKYYYVLLAVLVAACIAAYGSNRIVHDRINLIFSEVSLFLSGQAQTNIGQRFLMWKAAFRMFLSNPLFGVGTGDYVRTMTAYIQSGEMPAYLSEFNQPHNIYLFALATNGLLGLGALLYLFWRVFSFSYPLVHGPEEGRFYGVLAFSVAIHYMTAGFTDSFFNIQMLRYTFAFIIGLSVRSGLQRYFPSK